jgi:hypothetical protein
VPKALGKLGQKYQHSSFGKTPVLLSRWRGYQYSGIVLIITQNDAGLPRYFGNLSGLSRIYTMTLT